MHDQDLEQRETDTQWGHWDYLKCPVRGCYVCCGVDQVEPYLASARGQLYEVYRQLPLDKMKCYCCNALTMTMSHSEQNPGRLFFKCSKRLCDFFQWVNKYPTGKRRLWLEADKFITLFDGRFIKRTLQDVMKETQKGVGPFEGNWHPEDMKVTPKEKLRLEQRGLQDMVHNAVQKEVEWHMYK